MVTDRVLETKTGGGDVSPFVSVIMGCRNVGPFIDAALWSARRQTLSQIEIIVVDDQSDDDTAQRVRVHAQDDPRVILLQGPGRGPAAARNAALDAARGDFVAVLDGDDIMHPQRLAMLLAKAAATRADIVADNLLAFHDDPAGRRPYLLLGEAEWSHDRTIDLVTFVRSNIMFSRQAPLGYLKPLMRGSLFGAEGFRYDETLRIGEDYDILARMMAAGSRFHFIAAPLYFYRRHATSTSHRLKAADLTALIAAARQFDKGCPRKPDLLAASHRRLDKLIVALAFTDAVDALKARRPDRLLRALATRPAAIPLLLSALKGAVGNRLKRLRAKPGESAAAQRPRILLLAQSEHATPARLKAEASLPDSDIVLVRCPASAVPAPASLLRHSGWSELPLKLAGLGVFSHIAMDNAALAELTPFTLSPQAELTIVSFAPPDIAQVQAERFAASAIPSSHVTSA
ncbi:MAG TPA: glycosyltransferase family A protein [Candidatus Sulfotelmatobacter sp.]|jgi:succinoglycan biosynthesis protein ExoO|nr:glycosyltransferase family A protein [Candidatus Sulfotelmatobacter sp.]